MTGQDGRNNYGDGGTTVRRAGADDDIDRHPPMIIRGEEDDDERNNRATTTMRHQRAGSGPTVGGSSCHRRGRSSSSSSDAATATTATAMTATAMTAMARRGERGASASSNKRFATRMAIASTAFTAGLFLVLYASFSEWRWRDGGTGAGAAAAGGGGGVQEDDAHRHRRLEQAIYYDNDIVDYSNYDYHGGDASAVVDGNYTSFRCFDIFANTPSPSSSSGGGEDDADADDDGQPDKRCQYAKTCEGSGLLLPAIFCRTSVLSTSSWLIMLSPPLLLGLTLLFRLLGSTADEYFSPSLEMFSTKLGLPPRFAGVTLLALGNGASDVSATMNAIWNDPEDGYKMSLGALTGASMFITTVVAGSVVVANGGVVCRGALLRDVAALGVTVVVVASTLEGGTVGPGVSFSFFSFVRMRDVIL